MLDRRTMMGGAMGLAALAATRPAWGQAAGETMTQWPPAEYFPLWPGRPPGSPKVLPKPNNSMNGGPPRRELWLRGVAEPVVGVFRPANPDGRALLALPGGGYAFISVENEGINVAKTFNPKGVTVFVLAYRLPGEGWADPQDVPLQDGQRAMRLIRANAAKYGIDPAKLGCVGFSAGGLLSSSLAVAYDDPVYAKVDEADAQSARPAFAGIIYPVTSGDRMRIGKLPSSRFDASKRISKGAPPWNYGTPPIFIVHALDDDLVPTDSPMAMLNACREAGVPVEAHFLQEGGHGFGPRYLAPELTGSQWTEWFELWMKRTLAQATPA
jgi:acetyl esterase/lipase